jgi:hypothetical protein
MFDYFQVATPVVALAINVSGQMLAARTGPQEGLVRSVFIGFATGMLGLVGLGILGPFRPSGPWQDVVAIILVNTVTYVALSYCFFAFLGLGKTSIRIRLFGELRESGRGLTVDQILRLYDYRSILDLRLKRLISSKQVIKRDGRYFLGGSSLWFLATLVRCAKWLVLGKISQFDYTSRATLPEVDGCDLNGQPAGNRSPQTARLP